MIVRALNVQRRRLEKLVVIIVVIAKRLTPSPPLFLIRDKFPIVVQIYHLRQFRRQIRRFHIIQIVVASSISRRVVVVVDLSRQKRRIRIGNVPRVTLIFIIDASTAGPTASDISELLHALSFFS